MRAALLPPASSAPPRRGPATTGFRALASVVLVLLAMVGLNLWWYGTYRRGYPMHVDESGYTAFNLGLAQAFRYGGISGLVHAFAA